MKLCRDIVELYLLVMPGQTIKFSRVAPERAGILYNDCVYLSFALLTLGYKISSDKSSPAILFDLVPAVRSFGSKTLEDEMVTQYSTVATAVSMMPVVVTEEFHPFWHHRREASLVCTGRGCRQGCLEHGQ